MLLRLQVNGFKNLMDVDVRFGPFTCIAGGNGVGKSNVLDAIQLLGALATSPLNEAIASLRGDASQPYQSQAIFFQPETGAQITISADILMPTHGTDPFGGTVETKVPLLHYAVKIVLADLQRPIIVEESLRSLTPGEGRESLAGFASIELFASQQPEEPLIFLETDPDGLFRQLLPESYDIRRKVASDQTTRSLLSVAEPTLFPTAYLLQQEMQSWKFLHLEPNALRLPDAIGSDISQLAANGAHLTASLAAVAQQAPDDDAREDLFVDLARQLDRLIGDVRSIGIDRDIIRNIQAFFIVDRLGHKLMARSLSDGTLRFLALAILAHDERPGVYGIEEPENGLHPERIESMIDLLRAIAFDPNFATDASNPLRQTIITTHSPVVVSHVPDDSLLYAELTRRKMIAPDRHCSVARTVQFGGKRKYERDPVSLAWRRTE